MLFGRELLAWGLLAASVVTSSPVVKHWNLPEKKPNLEDNKYFHEPGNTDLSGHYDIRYFSEIVNYDTRLDTLKHMVRAWLQTTAAEGIETWIAHGTLLGWWWAGGILPWDWDLDVQVTGDTLLHLGDNYNMTMHDYTSADGSVKRQYLLDINPWSLERTRGDGMNIIDARWIDVRNGLFIDITGISEVNPEKPGVLMCKNFHEYKYDDIWPLRETMFEGVPALIPFNYDEILIEEYTANALILTEYEGHRWNPATKVWDIAPEVPAGKEAEYLRNHPPASFSTKVIRFFIAMAVLAGLFWVWVNRIKVMGLAEKVWEQVKAFILNIRAMKSGRSRQKTVADKWRFSSERKRAFA